MPTRLILITGGSGTGKTTLARALQERLLPDAWFHFSPDTLLYCLPKTIVDRADFANDWSAIDTSLIGELAQDCARAALQSGAGVVFDSVVMTERRTRQLLAAFRTSDPLLVQTTCAWDEMVRRTTARGDRTLQEMQRGFETSGQFLESDCVLDTGARPLEHLVDEVLDRLRHKVGASAWQRNLLRYGEAGDG